MTKDKRTRELKIAVALAKSEHGKESARQMVPFWAHGQGKCDAPDISSLARAIGANRTSLSLCLGCSSGGYWAIRKKLDHHLGLTSGGMSDVLSVVEAL